MRVLILILSHNVGPSIAGSLATLHTQFVNDPATELLLIDDASTDDTFKIADQFRRDHKFPNLKVIRVPHVQGEGGNQKVGFRYALDKGFEAVLVLHGERIYSPPALIALAQALKGSDADVALGFARRSRPWNLVSKLQSRLSGVRLEGWHSLYKGYRTQALSRVAFELDTNDPSFETELLLQLIDQKCRLSPVHLSLPAGWPAQQRQNLQLAWKHVKASLKYRLQNYNLFYDFRYHPDALSDVRKAEIPPPAYSQKLDLNSPHSYVCRHPRLIPSGSRVLDIGCSTGYVAEHLVRSRQCDVVGIDQLPPSMMRGKPFVYHQVDLEKDFGALRKILEQESFDVILMLDVLEHLALPELFLLHLRHIRYRKPPIFIFSTGNVAFLVIRLMLLLGHFNYGEKGILDITHKRLFSFRTFKNLFDQTGFVILQRIGFPLPYRALGLPRWLCRLAEVCNTGLIKIRRSLFAYQIMFVTTPLVLPEQVLAQSLEGNPHISARKPSEERL